jgi:hypothetical protein
MKILCFLVAVAIPLFAMADEIDFQAHAKDLVISLRPHTIKPTFGDKLILQLTLVNQGSEAIRAPEFVLDLVEFRARDPISRTEYSFGAETGFGGAMRARPIQTVSYAPNQRITGFLTLGLPGNANRFDHPFWQRLNGAEQLDIYCEFQIALGAKLKLVSDVVPIRIEPRPASELAALQRYAATVKGPIDSAIFPGNFGGISLNGLRTRAQVRELASEIKSPELAGIIQLTLLMQQLKHDDVDRNEVSQKVLDWIREQPDLKRQWVARQVAGHQLLLSPPVFEKLRAIGYGPIPPREP